MRMSDLQVYSVKSQEEFNTLIRSRGIQAVLFPSQEMLQTESERLLRFANRAMVRSLLLPAADEIKKASRLSLPYQKYASKTY